MAASSTPSPSLSFVFDVFSCIYNSGSDFAQPPIVCAHNQSHRVFALTIPVSVLRSFSRCNSKRHKSKEAEHRIEPYLLQSKRIECVTANRASVSYFLCTGSPRRKVSEKEKSTAESLSAGPANSNKVDLSKFI